MDLNEYQEKAIKTAVFPKDKALPYLALGLSGEAAEVANKVKKILRGDYDNDPAAAEEALDAIAVELGDVLWYVAVLASELDTKLNAVAACNVDKLAARAMNDTIKGSGDDR